MKTLDNAFALLIGVGNDLPETVTDANAIYNLLADKNLAGYSPNNITILTEEDAVRPKILKAFDDLIEKTNEESSVLLYYSGHGGTDDDKMFWIQPFDMTAENYDTTWVKAEEIQKKIAQIKSRRLIFFLDCCHAAGIGKNTNNKLAVENPTPELKKADGLAQKIDDGNGMSIITSCREDQISAVLEGDENSLFTKCLLEVLKGEHKTNFDDPFVRMSEVIRYIFKKVPEIYPEQNPYANLQIYDDFILSKVSNYTNNSHNSSLSEDVITSKSSSVKEVVKVYKESKNANNLLIFVHGFSGEATKSFGKIPYFLSEEQKFDGWDIIPFGYTPNVNPELGKNIWASSNDIQRIADHLSTSIKYRFKKYNRIAIVGHSLGGLVAKRAILDLSKKDQNRISHLLLFATPNNGISRETIVKIDNNETSSIGTESEFISKLKVDWKTYSIDNNSANIKIIAATKDEFISVESCFNDHEKEDKLTLDGSHFSLVNQSTKDNDTYQLILNSLCNNTFTKQYTDENEVNILIGEYSKVINELLPIQKELDQNGLAQLIFALEGLDRSEEAVQLLQQHELSRDNSDLLGILGGRFKRKYLSKPRKSDGDLALKYYGDALKIAEEKNDDRQIYYHAINLAFLNLIINNNFRQMKFYAEKALDSISNDPFDNLWKLATLGEIYMYLGDFGKSRENYDKASKMAGIREKISIYTNASTGYSFLMNTTNEDNEFLKFLKQRFLS